ncbi:hypothetical protein AB0D67_03640 [Streptosporangium sp. NPDC048047]|uniref:hypothetical protein n=1 Tax=Streptosporangium sp. NPDC048047 TaxID=3155748 RepID=UPI003417CE18
MALFALTVARNPARDFQGDAIRYWRGAQTGWAFLFGDAPATGGASTSALTTDTPVIQHAALGLRGVLAFVVYAPAALADRLAAGSGAAAVLVENALIIAVLGAVVLPAIARTLGVRGPATICWCAAGVWLLVAPFAPYPLMDVPAAAVFLCAVLLASAGSRRCLVAAGLCAGIALNLRPAYLVPLAAVVVVIAAVRRLRGLWLLPGVAVALVPQFAVNAVGGFGWFPVPPLSGSLANFQAGLSSYIVRYDTLLAGPPQQFYCDPHMAHAFLGRAVTSVADLPFTMLTNLPWSAVFLLEKFSAALAWSPHVPYSVPPADESYSLLLPVAAITVCGTSALIAAALRRGSAGRRPEAALVAAAMLGACVTLLASAAETRFALPVVLLGIVGSALALASIRRSRTVRPVWAVAVAAGTLVVVVSATAGLSHPLPPLPVGALEIHDCAAPG